MSEVYRYSITKSLLSLPRVGISQYEFENILERFLLSTSNNNPTPEIDPIIYALDYDSEELIKLRSEVLEKGGTPDLARELSQTIIEKFNEFLKQETIPRLRSSLSEIPEARLKLLRKKADDDAITKMLYRYKSLLPKGQQWGFNPKMYENLVKNYNVVLEAFASPLNSQIITLGDYNFGSLFYDTDAVFGSIGNIFKVDLEAFVKEREGLVGIMFNPPYVEKIMNDTFDLIEKLLEKTQARCILNVPNWKDAQFNIRANKSKFLVYKEEMQPRAHEYYFEGEKIVASFASVIYVFEREATGANFSDLTWGYRIEINRFPESIINQAKKFGYNYYENLEIDAATLKSALLPSQIRQVEKIFKKHIRVDPKMLLDYNPGVGVDLIFLYDYFRATNIDALGDNDKREQLLRRNIAGRNIIVIRESRLEEYDMIYVNMMEKEVDLGKFKAKRLILKVPASYDPGEHPSEKITKYGGEVSFQLVFVK